MVGSMQVYRQVCRCDDQMSLLSLGTVDRRSVLSFDVNHDQMSLLPIGKPLGMYTLDQKFIRSLEALSNDSGFYSQSSSQVTLNNLMTPLPTARSWHPISTVSNKQKLSCMYTPERSAQLSQPLQLSHRHTSRDTSGTNTQNSKRTYLTSLGQSNWQLWKSAFPSPHRRKE